MFTSRDPRRAKQNCRTLFPIRPALLVRRAPAHLLGLAVAAVLLATLLVPLTGSPSGAAAAQEEPVPTETADPTLPDDGGEGDEIPTDPADPADPTDPTDPTDPGEQPDAEPTPAPSASPKPSASPRPSTRPDAEEMPDADGTPEAGLLPNGIAEAAIHVMMRECDSTYGDDFKQLDAKCRGPVDVAFDVYGGGILQKSATGYLSVRGLPAGQYTIREHVPQTFYYPTVFCGSGPATTNAASYDEVVTVDGYYEFDLGRTQTINCQWFHISKDAVGALTVFKSFCPENAPFDYEEAERADLAAHCDPYKGGDVSFDLLSHTSGATTTQTTNRTDGAATWDNVPVGRVTVTEEPRNGYGTPIIWCYFGSTPTEFHKFDADHMSVTFDIPAGQATACNWFNIPDGAGDPDPSDSPDDEAGSVTVTKYACPEGTGKVHGGYEAYARTCAETVEGISFKLDGVTSGNPGDYPTNAKGQVSWDGLEADHFYLTESVPAGYGKPAAFCDAYKPLDEQPPAYKSYLVSAEGRIAFNLKEGEAVNCAWFTIPNGKAVSEITVDALVCPADTGLDQLSFEELAPICVPSPIGSITFGLDGAREVQTDAAGRAGWTDLKSGHYALSERVPLGFGKPIVFCDTYRSATEDNPVYDRAAVAGGVRIEFDLKPGERIRCSWFNVPYEVGGGLNIYTMVCPEDAAFDYYAADLAALEGRCTSYTGDDVAYDLFTEATGRIETQPINTANGDVAFSLLPAGKATITEHALAGYGKPVVACFDGGIFTALPVEVTRWSANLAIAAGQNVICTFVNIPGQQEPAAGSLTIFAYTCQHGVGCAPAAAGETNFALLNHLTGETQNRATGPDGSAAWEQAAAGLTNVAAVGPAGYGSPTVFCHAAGQTQSALAVEVTDVTAEFTMPAGQDVSCFWITAPAA